MRFQCPSYDLVFALPAPYRCGIVADASKNDGRNVTWDLYVAIVLVLAAPFVGRFLAMLVVRYPNWRGIWFARSACSRCAVPLSVRAQLPLLGWLLDGGHCPACGQRTPGLVLLFEIAALAIAIWSLAVFDGIAAVSAAMLGWLLIAAAAIDQRTMLLPDSLTAAALLLGFAVAAAAGPNALLSALAGAAAGFAAFALIGAFFRRLHGHDGLGLGDAKLLAAAGAWVGWQSLPSLVLIAASTAIVVILLTGLVGDGGIRRRLPFGPHLGLAAWLTLLYRPLP